MPFHDENPIGDSFTKTGDYKSSFKPGLWTGLLRDAKKIIVPAVILISGVIFYIEIKKYLL